MELLLTYPTCFDWLMRVVGELALIFGGILRLFWGKWGGFEVIVYLLISSRGRCILGIFFRFITESTGFFFNWSNVFSK